jgi:hypothetical protein
MNLLNLGMVGVWIFVLKNFWIWFFGGINQKQGGGRYEKNIQADSLWGSYMRNYSFALYHL